MWVYMYDITSRSHDPHMTQHLPENSQSVVHCLLSVVMVTVEGVEHLLIDVMIKPETTQLRDHHHQLRQSWREKGAWFGSISGGCGLRRPWVAMVLIRMAPSCILVALGTRVARQRRTTSVPLLSLLTVNLQARSYRSVCDGVRE